MTGNVTWGVAFQVVYEIVIILTSIIALLAYIAVVIWLGNMLFRFVGGKWI